MPGLAGSPLFVDVRQVCTVAEDFETTVTNLVEHFGIGPFRCWHFRPPRLYGTTYRGEPAVYSMKLAITWLDDVQWEVITPVEGPTMYGDHLATHGRGVQHLIMSTGRVSWEEAARHLAERGHPFGQTAKLNAKVKIGRVKLPSVPNALAGPTSLQFGYVDAESTLRTSIELTRYPLGIPERFSLRAGAPEFCIPAGKANFERPLPDRRIGSLVKIGIVTRDLDATVRWWIDLAGVGPWRIHELGREQLRSVRVAGKKAAFRARLAWARIGQALIELIEPVDGACPYRDVLETRGEGVAYLGVLPGRDGFEALARHCRSLGYTPELTGALRGDHPSIYFGARRWIGTDLEILAPAGETLAQLAERLPPDRVGGV